MLEDPNRIFQVTKRGIWAGSERISFKAWPAGKE
jgi:hypothetical protein